MEHEELLARSPAVVSMNSCREGKTSYANNSKQRGIASVTKKARQDMAAALYRARGRPASMAIADLGCASGPNALLLVSDAVEAVLAEKEVGMDGAVAPQLHVFLNDLPGNDFNAVFRLLSSSPLAGSGCLVSAWPGSFHGRIFPDASLDYVVSSCSLHFLSKVAKQSEDSPAAVLEEYWTQFQADFSAFLRCRAAELRPGSLLLTFLARRAARHTAQDCYLWDLLADALMEMAAAGHVGEELVHTFNLPFYCPCPRDLVDVISKEGSSFSVATMQLFDFTRPGLLRSQPSEEEEEEEVPRWLAVETVNSVRAALEPMLRAHFGRDAMDGLFCRYRLLLEAYYLSEATKNNDSITNVFLVLEKKQH